jgi:multicomponent Na+:H+ antiporter subunit B
MTVTDEAIERARSEPAGGGWHRPRIGIALVGALGAALAAGLVDLPREASALPEVARHAMAIALPKWGQQEVVNEIVYGSRGFDTFGETFLLLAAVMSVIVLARGREPRGEYVGESSAGRTEQAEIDPAAQPPDTEQAEAREADEQEEEDGRAGTPPDADLGALGTFAPERAQAMTVVTRLSARIAAVMLAVISVYIAAWGYSPGGGFPAGVAVTGVVILLYAAFGQAAVRVAVRPPVLEPVEIFVALVIIAIGLFGLLFRGSLFANFLTLAQPGTIRAGGTNQLFSAAELVEVATGLVIAIFSLLGMRHEWTSDEEDEGGGGR